MKKFTLFLLSMAMMATTAMAGNDDTFQFVTADGTVVPDGSIVNCTQVEVDEFEQTIIPSGLFLHNITDQSQGVKLTLTPTALPSGALQLCCLGNCTQTGGDPLEKSGVLAKDKKDDLMLEWILESEDDRGTASATLNTKVCEIETGQFGQQTAGAEIEDGPAITLNFVNDPAGIENISNPSNGVVEIVGRYNAAGQQMQAPAKGLNIVKTADGRTIKQLIK